MASASEIPDTPTQLVRAAHKRKPLSPYRITAKVPGSKHRAGADAADHFPVAGPQACRPRRDRTMADAIHNCANAIAGTIDCLTGTEIPERGHTSDFRGLLLRNRGCRISGRSRSPALSPGGPVECSHCPH